MKEYKNEGFMQYLDIIEDIIREGQEKGLFRKDVIPGVAKRAFLVRSMRCPGFGYCQVASNMISKPSAKQISGFFLSGIKK
jgi:TetR/AcrR family fatty acid metabolism transcriptional regulator